MNQSHFVKAQASLRGALLLFIVGIFFWGGVQQVSTVSAKPVPQSGESLLAGCPAGRYCAYLPAISVPLPGDLVLSGVEVSQAVQTPENSIHLVAGRQTVLRIYANTRDFKTAVPSVKITVLAANANNVLLSDSPKAYSVALPTSSSRANYSSSINIPLPANWLSGTINLTVKLDPDNSIAETSESNNTITQRLVFNSVPPLKVTVVPINYYHTGDGRTYPAPTRDTVSDWIYRTYPISQLDITWHAPYNFRGNLSTGADFSRLLNEITTIKSTEGAPKSRVYYGLIPTSNGSTSWFAGGYAGLGWVGSRVAIGLDYEYQTSEIAAHEIGHNLGMSHTPCGGAASTDPNFPYPDGSIGQYGLDVRSGIIYPPSSKDVMTYCDPKWVSDYTYEKLYSNQVQYGASSAATFLAPAQAADGSQRSLLVRANIKADKVELMPVYVLPGQASEAPEAGEYLVEVLGAQGETLAQTPVRAYQAMEEGDLQVNSIHAVVALPDQPAARLRLSKDGQVLAEQALETALARQGALASPGATVEQSSNGTSLRWDNAQQGALPAGETAVEQDKAPALVRYSTDGGSTWTTLAVDVTGSALSLPSGVPADAIYEVISAE